ncbi:MAG: hypothetical protein ACRETK_08485, partial [Steroidobacteraceae bacterium]
MRKPVWLGLVAILILAAAAVLFYSWRANRHAARIVVPVTAPKAPVAAAPQIANPVPPSTANAEQPLPTLGDSDGPVRDGIAALAGQAATERLVKPD